MNRPTGVTIIAVLMAIAGIIMIISGISALVLSPFIPAAVTNQDLPIGLSSSMLGGFAAGSGIIMLILGLAGLGISYGLFKGRSWAWTAAVVLSIIGIIMGIVSIVSGNFGSIIGLIINGVILYYLYRPHVKVFFGKRISTPAADTAAA